MASTTEKFIKDNIISDTPKFLRDAVQYETITGSMAYGCSTDSSDMDIYGFCIPPKDYTFPHLAGYINGLDNTNPRFEQYQKHHIKVDDKEYDLTIYGIVKFFKLVMENNPNMVDTLFTSRNCVLHSTAIGEHVRENRKLFLHKGSYHKFKGYAYGQLSKMKNKKIIEYVDLCKEVKLDPYNHLLGRSEDGYERGLAGKIMRVDILHHELTLGGKMSKRLPSIIEHGYDVKFAYHIIRLLNEAEQILTTHDLNLKRDKEIYKAIRRGEWSKEKVIEYFDSNEKSLQSSYEASTLQHSPDRGRIRKLLLECLEMHYGSLEKVIQNNGVCEVAIREIKDIVGNL